MPGDSSSSVSVHRRVTFHYHSIANRFRSDSDDLRVLNHDDGVRNLVLDSQLLESLHLFGHDSMLDHPRSEDSDFSHFLTSGDVDRMSECLQYTLMESFRHGWMGVNRSSHIF